MKRRYEPLLLEWLNKKRRKPLVIRGARQIGKSTLVRSFAKAAKKILVEVNLERSRRLRSVFSSLDTGKILEEIAFETGQGPIDPNHCILFLDEVQGVPEALQSLRYFYEDMPELPVIAAGSLLEFTLAKHSFPMPVGRIEYFHMGPVVFEEFLAAKEESQLLELIGNWQMGEHFPITGHDRLVRLMREYLMTGGMPEAIQAYLDEGTFDAAFDVQRSLTETYQDDFSKYASGADLERLQSVLDFAARTPGEKVKYVSIDSLAQARETKKAMGLLLKAGVVFKVRHSDATGVPLGASVREKVFKLYSLDLGLMLRASGLSHLSETEIVTAEFINKGKIAEQFLAQHLYYHDTPREKPQLFYWLREGAANNAEVDFVLSRGTSIFAVEVKAGASGSLKSLVQFNHEKSRTKSIRFDLNPPSIMLAKSRLSMKGQDVEFDYDLVSLPLYMVGQIDRFL